MKNDNNSILGIPNSILAYYKAQPHNSTLSVLDERLQKEYKNVVLMIFDGLGTDLLEKNAPESFMLNNRITDITSVCPSTTTSAITTLLTGLSPVEHGWLGWSCYFKEINKCVDLFTGNHSETERLAADYDIVSENIGFKNILEQISTASPKINCTSVTPFSDPKATTCQEICSHVSELCKSDGRQFIYAYHFQPDYDMHTCGCYDEHIKNMINSFDIQIENLSKELNDTLLIVSADHGHKNIKMLCIEDFPEISECLSVPPSREPRNLSFFIKDNYKEVFPKRWNEKFGNSFRLMKSTEAIELGIFGSGIPHRRAYDFVGDYVALAIGDLALWYKNEDGEYKNHLSAHAGLCHEEMIVPLILIEK